jgi:hypothetical protein
MQCAQTVGIGLPLKDTGSAHVLKEAQGGAGDGQP